MKAILRYTNCLLDGKNVFGILSAHNAHIIKTKHRNSIYPRITIKIKNYDELNHLIYEINSKSTYGVELIKVKPDNRILDLIKKIFNNK